MFGDNYEGRRLFVHVKGLNGSKKFGIISEILTHRPETRSNRTGNYLDLNRLNIVSWTREDVLFALVEAAKEIKPENLCLIE